MYKQNSTDIEFVAPESKAFNNLQPRTLWQNSTSLFVLNIGHGKIM